MVHIGERELASSVGVSVAAVVIVILTSIMIVIFLYHYWFAKLSSSKESFERPSFCHVSSSSLWLTVSSLLVLMDIWLLVAYRRIRYTSAPLTQSMCHWLAFAMINTYILSKTVVYFFYICRLGEVLDTTTISYSSKFRIALGALNLCFCVVGVVLSWRASYALVPEQLDWGGHICVPNREGEWLQVTLFTILSDVIWMHITGSLLTNKLMQLVRSTLKVNVHQSTRSVIEDTVRSSMYEASSMVEKFHEQTKHDNSLLLVCCKLAVLKNIQCLSSVVLMVLYVKYSDLALLLDCAINILTLALNFKFSERIFYALGGHKYCIRCAFPFLKMIAFSETTSDLVCHFVFRKEKKRKRKQKEKEKHEEDGCEEAGSISPPITPDTCSLDEVDLQIQKSGRSADIVPELRRATEELSNKDNLPCLCKCCGCCVSTLARNVYVLSGDEFRLKYLVQNKASETPVAPKTHAVPIAPVTPIIHVAPITPVAAVTRKE